MGVLCRCWTKAGSCRSESALQCARKRCAHQLVCLCLHKQLQLGHLFLQRLLLHLRQNINIAV